MSPHRIGLRPRARPLRLPLKGGVILPSSSVADNPQGTVKKPWIARIAVIPAHAGIQGLCFLYLSFRFIVFLGRPAIRYSRLLWIPAFAGMTVNTLDWGQEHPRAVFSTTPKQGRFANRPYLILKTRMIHHENPPERTFYSSLKYSSSSGRAFQFGLVGHSLWRETLSPP